MMKPGDDIVSHCYQPYFGELLCHHKALFIFGRVMAWHLLDELER